MNIACWSGPRNLSTAMMYAFGARADCDVVDEPFYGAYLKETGLIHPMGEEIISGMECDPSRVAKDCASARATPHFYQKHMTHHMIEGFDRSWFSQVKHVFLIRHPARVLASYSIKRENPSLSDIGFVQQAEIFDAVGGVVIDSHDIRDAPEQMLKKLCAALDLPFDPAMLSWPAGGHARDGIWAPHWYDAVHKSTGFAGAEGPLPEVASELQDVLTAALPYYDKLKAHKL